MAWDTTVVDNIKESMEVSMSELSIDNIASEGMTVRIGGRVVKLEITEEITLPEDDIRAEYSAKLTEKLQRIKEVLNEKMSEMTYMVEQNKQDFEEKEREMQARINSANLMPDINYSHARAGLSVVKNNPRANGEDVMTWLYQGVYWPKFVDGNPIEPKYSKRMISPVTLEIITEKDRVSRVVVRKTIGLSKFEHYHSMDSSSDCWGQWSPRSHWKSADDIMAVGREAIAVLENVNSSSPGNRSPNGLPRLGTLLQHLLSRTETNLDTYEVSRADERAGISQETESNRTAVWST